MKKVLLVLVGLMIFCALMFGLYWLAKNLTYWLWYEEMVKATIRELVKESALK